MIPTHTALLDHQKACVAQHRPGQTCAGSDDRCGLSDDVGRQFACLEHRRRELLLFAEGQKYAAGMGERREQP